MVQEQLAHVNLAETYNTANRNGSIHLENTP